MEVEFATGSVWLGGAKISSATAEQPKSAVWELRKAELL